jgi:hypothetical protein
MKRYISFLLATLSPSHPWRVSSKALLPKLQSHYHPATPLLLFRRHLHSAIIFIPPSLSFIDHLDFPPSLLFRHHLDFPLSSSHRHYLHSAIIFIPPSLSFIGHLDFPPSLLFRRHLDFPLSS